MSDNYVKKLTAYELLFDRLQRQGNYNVVRVFIVESRLDFNQNRNCVEKSLNDWKHLHAMLRFKIVNDENDPYKAYFAYMPEEKLAKNENVQFVWVENDHDVDCWKYLVETELARAFDSEHELLWRLKFIKLTTIQVENEPDMHKYCILMVNHHAITDGPNAYEIINELLEIIEANHLNKPMKIDDNRRLSCTYEYAYPNDPRVVEFSPDEINESEFAFETFAAPRFKSLNPTGNPTNKIIKGEFYTIDGEKLTILDDGQLNTGVRFFSIDKTLLGKLLAKCRKNDVKLTNCLDLAIALSLRQVYVRYLINPEELVPIRNNLTINMRRFMEPPVDIRVMGLFLTSMLFSYDNELDQAQDDEGSFWQIARAKFDELYANINAKKFLDKESITWIEKFYLLATKHLPDSSSVAKSETLTEHYVISNIGPVAASPKNSTLFKIDEYYSALSFTKSNGFECSYCSMCTIDNRLYMCVTFNKAHFSNEVVDYWIQCINENFHRLTKDE